VVGYADVTGAQARLAKWCTHDERHGAGGVREPAGGRT
jgi:hypothetical protein